MIGTKIRGFRHLSKMAETLGDVKFFYKCNDGIAEGVAVFVPQTTLKNPYGHSDSDYCLIFTRHYSSVPFNVEHYSGTEMYSKLRDLVMRYRGVTIFTMNKCQLMGKEVDRFVFGIVAQPKDFDKQYENFCQANKNNMNTVVGKLYDDTQNSMLRYCFAVTNGSKNFFFWAVNAIGRFRQSVHQIEKIMLWDEMYGKMANKLSKGSITAYTGKYSLTGLMRELFLLRRDKRANDIINTFNTAQKKALKSHKLTDRDYETLSRFAKLSGKKKSNFIKKVSSIEDVKEVLRQMSFLADIQFEWNKESFIDYLKNNENLSYEIMLDRDNLMVLKVNDYETIKRLTKATNWCISKDKKYWTDYIEMRPESNQYVIFDFSRKEDHDLSIVGFTCDKKNGITNSHDFQNRNLMGNKGRGNGGEIKSFIRKTLNSSNIFSVLNFNSIDLSLFIPSEKSVFEWSREGVFSYLEKCVDEEDYYILADYGDRFVIMCENKDIKYFFGDKYMEMLYDRGEDSCTEYIVFIDLTKSATDRQRMIFGLISYDYDKGESACNRLYNANCESASVSFNKMLSQYGLPYDTICRSDDACDRFNKAFRNMDIIECRELIKNKKVQEYLKHRDYRSTVGSLLNHVTFNFHSSDYLDLLYSMEGVTLDSLAGADQTIYFTDMVLRRLYDYGNQDAACLTVPTVEEMEAFDKGTFTGDESRQCYIGYFSLLQKMLERETSNYVCDRIVQYFHSRSLSCEVADCLLSVIADKIDFDKNYKTAQMLIKYAAANRAQRIINVLSRKKVTNEKTKMMLNSIKIQQLTTETWVLDNEHHTFTIVNETEPAIAH